MYKFYIIYVKCVKEIKKIEIYKWIDSFNWMQIILYLLLLSFISLSNQLINQFAYNIIVIYKAILFYLYSKIIKNNHKI